MKIQVANHFPSRRSFFRLFFLAGVSGLLCACQSVPYTGRHHLMLVSQDEEIKMGEQAYSETLKKSELSPDRDRIALLRRVGRRLAQAAEKPDYRWEFNLIREDKTLNAWCLPGGKVAVYTGLWSVLRDEDGLAVVLGHEIAHALARHGAERMSQAMLANVGNEALSLALAGKSGATQNVFNQAYGLGVGLGVMLPYSRKQESEADHIGLILMAKAGYDPGAAVDFWGRMMKTVGGKAPQDPLARFLSDHPLDEDRRKAIEDWLPEARGYYRPTP